MDGFGENDSGDYRLELRDNGCDEPVPPVCEPEGQVALGGMVNGSSFGASQSRGSCGGAGPEVVYTYRSALAREVCASTAGSDIDTVLYVRGGDCLDEGAEIACADDTGGLGLQSSVTFNVDANVEYFIFVDAFGAAGDVTLSLTEGACP